MTMVCGRVAMELLDAKAFHRLNDLGARVRTGIDEAFRSAGIEGQTTGMGSLLKMHFTRHPIHDYRSASPDAEAQHNMALFNAAALNEGILVSSYGLFALSTPMTDGDAQQIVGAVERALATMARS